MAQSSTVRCNSVSPHRSTALADMHPDVYVALHLQLQELFSTYKKERVESDKVLTAQADKLQEQLSDFRSQNTKVSTQLEFASKR